MTFTSFCILAGLVYDVYEIRSGDKNEIADGTYVLHLFISSLIQQPRQPIAFHIASLRLSVFATFTQYSGKLSFIASHDKYRVACCKHIALFRDTLFVPEHHATFGS